MRATTNGGELREGKAARRVLLHAATMRTFTRDSYRAEWLVTPREWGDWHFLLTERRSHRTVLTTLCDSGMLKLSSNCSPSSSLEAPSVTCFFLRMEVFLSQEARAVIRLGCGFSVRRIRRWMVNRCGTWLMLRCIGTLSATATTSTETAAGGATVCRCGSMHLVALLPLGPGLAGLNFIVERLPLLRRDI